MPSKDGRSCKSGPARAIAQTLERQSVNDFKTSASPSRRLLVKSLSLIPLYAIGMAGCAKERDEPAERAAVPGLAYKPSFFSGVEWAFLSAACDRLIPRDAIGPGALDAGVPEFIDRHMQTPYAAGDIWYMQGPFVEAGPEFGHQGRLPVRDILRVGIKAIDAHCQSRLGGKTFSEAAQSQQETLLSAAESGELALENISAKEFFSQLLAETRLGYFCDPIHGGNKNMAGWKMVGYPGARADYSDWVEVRDRPYALPPVDIAGKRG
jgi:gluconate 2-dehydrogenase gamma chain